MLIRDVLSTRKETDRAAEEIAESIRSAFGGDPPHVGLLFVTAHHRPKLAAAAKTIRAATGVRALAGCTAESVIAAGRELERTPGMAAWFARLPGIDVRSFHLEHGTSEEAIGFRGLPDGIGSAKAEGRVLVLLGEPFSFPVDDFIRDFNRIHVGIPIVGGMASAGSSPGKNLLLLDGKVHPEGAVGVLFEGPIRVRTVVSQGCRPVGKRYVVTAADRNLIFQLAGKSVASCVREFLENLPDDERFLFEKGPHIGVAIDEHKDEFGRGDFLIRNILGWEPKSGGLVVNDLLRRGQTVQFHVRDAAAATEDLGALLTHAGETGGTVPPPAGGLLFSCNGRGTRMFSEPDHDVRAVRDKAGSIPLAGFFAAGEIGPVGGENFLHGFTASVVLFAPTEAK